MAQLVLNHSSELESRSCAGAGGVGAFPGRGCLIRINHSYSKNVIGRMRRRGNSIDRVTSGRVRAGIRATAGWWFWIGVTSMASGYETGGVAAAPALTARIELHTKAVGS